MPKFWSYPEGLKVIINENVKGACPHHVGRKGKIIELFHSATYDYAVSDETGDITFFKEHELNPAKGG
ncbi:MULTISPECIES: YorP family protein [Bacillus]|uniref:YorP family protein n=1 Tax=Bacillus TaxID=1386 RepID=UPI001CD6B417|nr:YorP family protein [Bacillus amyloliquefaciens]